MPAVPMWKRMLLLLCLIAPMASSQNQPTDSLISVLPGLTGKERLEVLYILSNRLENTSPRDAREYGIEGVALALQLGDSLSLATLYSSLAYSSSELGDFEQSLKYGYQSLEVSTLIGDQKKQASAHSTLGIAFVYIGQYSKALEHHLEALRIREELGLVIPTANTLNNIGIVYHRIGQYDKAIEHYRKAMEKHGPGLPEIARVRQMTNIGYSEFRRGNIEAAMRYHSEAREIAERLNFRGSLAYIYFNLGIMLSEQKKYPEALEYLFRSLKNYEDLGQKYGTVQLLNAIGRLYMQTGKNDAALKYLNRAVALAQQIKAPDQQKESYEMLYQINDRSGNVAQSYRYYRLFSQAKDSLMNANESKKIAEIAIEHVTAQKQREIETLKSQKLIADLNLEQEETRTNILYGGIGLSVAVSGFLLFGYRRIHKHKKLAEEKNSELNRVNDELKVVNDDLQMKMSEIKLLTGLLPICSNCKKIRDDKGDWEVLEKYITHHSEATFSHGICPDCVEKLYGNILKKNY
jgi:tetratricopeptide (TPR) repeat protein